jgi:hypothetical protein
MADMVTPDDSGISRADGSIGEMEMEEGAQ